MSLIRRTSPFGDLLSLRQAMDRLFEDSFVRPGTLYTTEGGGAWLPLDVYATKDELVVKAAVPGVKPEDVDITIAGDTLTIATTYEEEKKDEERGYVVQEIRRGSSSRTLTLPADLNAEAASATFENGVLALRIPKSEAARPRQIKVTAGAGATAVGSGSSSNGR